MKCLTAKEEKEVLTYLHEAGEEAKKATCLRAKCGSVIVKDGKIVGRGFNSPPADLESQRRCEKKDELKKGFKSDRTCCIHAEARAIQDVMLHDPSSLRGARLYFVRVDDNGTIERSGEPYCTYCSKLALDSGLSEFVLWHKKGVCIYDTEEYNDLSFQYGDPVED